MCLIIGYCCSGVAYYQLRYGFDKTITYGLKDSRIVDTGKAIGTS